MSTDHSDASAGMSSTNGPLTFSKKSRLLEIHVGVPKPRQGSLHPIGSRWSWVPLGDQADLEPSSSPAS